MLAVLTLFHFQQGAILMTRLRRVFVACALLTSIFVFSTAEGFAGSQRRCRCYVACSPCVVNSATAPTAATPIVTSNTHDGAVPAPPTPPKPETKPAPRPLPEGVTAVTAEQLVEKIPNFFFYDYNFPPEPGKRVWVRANDHKFLERYPSGKETTFDVLGRATVEQLEGTLVVRVEVDGKGAPVAGRPEFRLFIPDKTLESRRLYYSHPQVNEGKWVYLGDVKTAE